MHTGIQRPAQPSDATTTSDIVLVDIAKNARGDFIRVALRSYRGNRFVDVRLHVANADGETVPTGKGIAIPPTMLEKVISGLEAALHDARAEGLL